MTKVGIIRCQQTEDLCPATTCLACAVHAQGSFSELGSCQVVGVISCGGCPGKRAVMRAQKLVEKGAEAIALASCISKGVPLNFPCPHYELMAQAIKAKIGDVPLLDHTH